jgi:hypothetical protein
MMRFYYLLLILFVISCAPKSSNELNAQTPPSYGTSPEKLSDDYENDFEVTDITLITVEGFNYLKVSIIDRNLKGGVYPFPNYKIVSDGVVIGEEKSGTYDLHVDGSKNVPTTLQTLPEDFECIVYISALEETLTKHELHYKATLKEEIPSKSNGINIPEESENTENIFEIFSLEFITIEGENYLRIFITDRNPIGKFYPYPCYEIISSDGEIIGGLGLKTYGLGGPEDIPTTLTALPENFECVVHLFTHGGMGVAGHKLVYKSK